ncbi:Fatty acid-binding protein [bioreactor metagenome]|uniref:Fatty acid-binding protein n=1 Tax=bioreactor metagenome TaxID=1076179 RepID=A0A645D3H1_9ZZZZ
MANGLISDSCCDYCEQSEELTGLRRVPLTIELGEERLRDDENLDIVALLKKIAACHVGVKTACPSPEDFADAMESQEGDAYVVTLSDKLSGSYASAQVGKTLCLERQQGKNVHIFNSLSAAAAQVAICLKINELLEQGKRFAEVVSETERFIHGITTLFVLEDLETLRKNGRLTQLQSVITGILKIKLVMCAEADGTIGMRGKAMSNGGALAKMVDLIRQKCADMSLLSRTLVITHCNCLERAEKVKQMILSVCPFQKAVICRASGISTVYASNGGIVVSF